MRKLNTNNTNNTTNGLGIIVWLGGKAILLGACLGLGGLTGMGATIGAATATPTLGTTIEIAKPAGPLRPDVSTNRAAAYNYGCGNNWAGLSTYFGVNGQGYARAWTNGWTRTPSGQFATGAYSQTYARAGVSAGATVKFLQQSGSAANFSASVVNNNGAKNASYCLNVAGETVASGSQGTSYQWGFEAGRTFITYTYPIQVGPVNVNLSGSLSGGADAHWTMELSEPKVGIFGSGAWWVAGTASVDVYRLVGLACELQLGKTELCGSVTASPTSISGSSNIYFLPISIRLYLWYLFGWGEKDLAHFGPWGERVYPLFRW
jgi:hypothetical protein